MIARKAALGVFLFLLFTLTTISINPSISASTTPAPSPTVPNYNYQVLSRTHTVSGEQRALIVLVEFPDVHHARSLEQIKDVAVNQLNQYYTEVSLGKVSIAGDVYGWYMTSHPMSFYGRDTKSPGDDNNVQSLAHDALTLLPSSLDLSPYKYLIVVHAGPDQADDQGSVLSNEIWSSCFCSVFPNYESYTPISERSKSFDNYAFLSEFNGVGTFAHEWGHIFGLPDLYDTNTEGSYVGFWSLMDVGNLCCYNVAETTPAYIGAWGDTLLGWLTPSVAESSIIVSSFNMTPLESQQPTAVLIPVSTTTYYFIEYRTRSGFDSHLPDSGILIYYADESLDSGGGILKLENPKTRSVFPAQQNLAPLGRATFHAGDQFSDLTHHIFVAFLGGGNTFTMLYSKQELTGEILRSSVRSSTSSLTGTYSDLITLTGSLLGENGSPLADQTIQVETLDSTTLQWQLIGSATSGQQGEISFQTRVNLDVGTYRVRFLYPGGKIGGVWYSSSTAEFEVNIAPARMTITVSSPSLVGPDRVSVEVLAQGLNGEPLPGVRITIYVDNVQKGVVQTDSNGRATFSLYLGLGDIGSHSITAKANSTNYIPASSSQSIIVTPPIWLLGIIIAVAAGVIALVVTQRYRRTTRTKRTEHPRTTISCARCGAELPADSAFCLECGAQTA